MLEVRLDADVEPHETQQILETRDATTKEMSAEDFLEPPIFNWSVDDFIVTEAIRKYLAEFYADH